MLFKVFKERNTIPSFFLFVIQVDFNVKMFGTKFLLCCLPCFKVKKPSYKILNYILIGINSRLRRGIDCR